MEKAPGGPSSGLPVPEGTTEKMEKDFLLLRAGNDTMRGSGF